LWPRQPRASLKGCEYAGKTLSSTLLSDLQE
jgi:hypothetical protein